MTQQPTRKQYMNKEVSFADFYRAIYQDAGISFEADDSLISEVQEAITNGDEHLNTIPLARWDAMGQEAQVRLSVAFKKHGDFYSMAGSVCALKQAARDAATT